MTFANQVKNTLLQDISDMAQMPWLFSKHPETDFSRKRKLDFQSLVHFCICMEAGTIRHELLKYFAYDSGTLSNSAFHQQRNNRGFHSLNVFAHAIEHNTYFLIRAKDVNMRCLLGNDLPDEESFDVQINRILTRSQSKKKQMHPELEDQYRFICQEVTFDYIEHGSGKEYPISLRIPLALFRLLN